MMNGMVGGRDIFMPDERAMPRSMPPQNGPMPMPEEGSINDQNRRQADQFLMLLRQLRENNPDAFEAAIEQFMGAEKGGTTLRQRDQGYAAAVDAPRYMRQRQMESQGFGPRMGYNPTY